MGKINSMGFSMNDSWREFKMQEDDDWEDDDDDDSAEDDDSEESY